MLTFIAFILTILGSINWLLIGLLQYDFIAGLFGFQASIFSRFFYILFGIGAVTLVIRIIANKGSVKVYEKRKKKEQTETKQESTASSPQSPTAPAMNVEASREFSAHGQNQNNFQTPNQNSQTQIPNTHSQNDYSNTKQFTSPPPISNPNSFRANPTDYYHDNLFDEHFDKDLQ